MNSTNSVEFERTFSYHRLNVNGVQLHYVIGGRGTPIVLLHGWPVTITARYLKMGSRIAKSSKQNYRCPFLQWEAKSRDLLQKLWSKRVGSDR